MANKYYDCHFLVDDDSKEGYSIFIIASDAQDALRIIASEGLFESPEDLYNIDYIGEISEQEYFASLS